MLISASLASASNTHLGRLEEFGDKHFIDQRQARRYSDRGVRQLARLVATNWTTQTVPEATIIVVGTDPGKVGFTVRVRCQRHVDMGKPKVGIWPADQLEPAPLAVNWQRTSAPDALWAEDEFESPEILTFEQETKIQLVWCGEIWPKFTVVLSGDIDAATVTAETLGATCAVSISPIEPKFRCPAMT